MSELIETMREEFHDKETRDIYVEDLLNTYIATQIKVLREEAGWTQAKLAEEAGMKQERISVLEDVNYSSWTAGALKRIAKALDVRLSIKFESFGSYLNEYKNLSRESLKRPSFKDDPAFQDKEITKGLGTGQQISEGVLSQLKVASVTTESKPQGLLNQLAGKDDKPEDSKEKSFIPKLRSIEDYKAAHKTTDKEIRNQNAAACATGT